MSVVGKALNKRREKMIEEFTGWIDERELKKIKKRGKGFFHPDRSLIIYDKHWYDGNCRKVEIKVLKEKK